MEVDDDVESAENLNIKRKYEEDDEFPAFSFISSNKKLKSNTDSREVEERSKSFPLSSSSSSKGWKSIDNSEGVEEYSCYSTPTSSPLKKGWKSVPKSREVEEHLINVTLTNARTPTSANDRLKNLRRELKADIEVSTSVNKVLEKSKNTTSSIASTSTVSSLKKSPPGYEVNQSSANCRLSMLRTNIHKEQEWKTEHMNNFKVSSSKTALTECSPKKLHISENRVENSNYEVDYVPKQYPYETSSKCKELDSSINVNISFRPKKNITNSHHRSSVHDQYARYEDCPPSTSKDKPVIIQKHEAPNEFSGAVNRNNKDYSQIIDALYKKYFENSETQVKISDGAFQKAGVSGLADYSMDWEDDVVVEPSTSKIKFNESRELHFVVDTNIFIHDFNILRDIIDGSNGSIKPIIFLPWMVISELNFMKDDNKSSSLRNKAQKAVCYINENILEENSAIKRQTIEEVHQQKYIGKSPDDKILSCCLFVKQKYHKMIFLSNDCHLRNKVMINGIPAISTSEILNASTTVAPEDSLVTTKLHETKKKILEEMSTCCSFIICECIMEAYGRAWNKMAMMSNPPWPLEMCIKIFRKYWRSVFRDKFLKQFMQSVDTFEEALKYFITCKSPKNFKEFVEAYSDLCFFFKDLQEHKEFVETSIKDVRAIVRTI